MSSLITVSTCSLHDKILDEDGDGISSGDGICSTIELTRALRISKQTHEDHLDEVDNVIEQFQLKAASKGWQLDGVTPSDGNCFFWAVSKQLDRLDMNNMTHVQLRSRVVKYKEDLSEVEKVQMSQFLTTSIEDYLEGMRRGGTYADHVVLQAMCNMLTCGMRIVHADVPDIILCSEMPKMMVLGYLPEIQHYVCLKPLISEFVAVHLSSRRKKVLYLAKVLQVENGDVELQYLKTTDDTSWQSESDIIERMSTPERLSRRGLQFKFDLSELNLCKAKL